MEKLENLNTLQPNAFSARTAEVDHGHYRMDVTHVYAVFLESKISPLMLLMHNGSHFASPAPSFSDSGSHILLMLTACSSYL